MRDKWQRKLRGVSRRRLRRQLAAKRGTAPVYLSARSADVILSEIRPTRLKPDALQSINELLDELLLHILTTSKSLTPARLKDGMLKLPPTPLGKEAVLEAELELRNHRDGSVPASTSSSDDGALDNSTIDSAFEVCTPTFARPIWQNS